MTCRLAYGLVLIGVLQFVSPVFAQPGGTATAEPNSRRVYVPLEELDQVVDRDQRGVILSRDEYSKLSGLAQKQAEAYPPSTHPIVAAKAEYSAEIADDQLVLTAVIDFTQLRPGWQTLALPFRNVAIERAALDDKPAQLGRAGAERTLVLFSSLPGRHTLSLKLSTSLVSLGSDRVAAFGLAPIPAARLQLALPAGQFLHADETPLERPTPADQPASYVLAVGGRSALNLRLAGRQATQQSASLVFASTAIGLNVAAEERTWRAVSTLNVFGKPIDSLQFVIPKSLDIVSVESTGLERWEIAAGPSDGTTALKLIYRQPVVDTRAVTFQGVSTGGLGEQWSVPTLGLTGAASHLMHVVVGQSAGLRLQPVAATGVRRITAAEATANDMTSSEKLATSEGTQVLHYAAWREDFSLQFVTRPRARELQATIATRVDVDARELGLRSSISVQSRFAPLFDLDLAIPVDWSVVEVLMGDQPARWRVVPVDASSNQIQISFQPPIPTDGKIALTLVARRIPGENWPIGNEPFVLPLPEVFLPQVGVTDGRYMIAADDELELSVDEMTGLDPVRLSDLEQRLARAPRLVYEYQDTRFQGMLRVTRRPLRLAAHTLAFHRLDRETLVSHLEARLAVQGGGLQKLDIALPESAGADLRFRIVNRANQAGPSPPEITEQSSAPPAAGERIWTLRFDQRVFGLLWLVVDLQTPRGAEEKEFVLPAMRILGAERQSGQIAVEAGADQQLKLTAVDAAGQPLADVDPADVSAPLSYLPHDRIVAAYQSIRAGYRIAVSETRFERQPVPTAICDKAALTSVVSQAGEMQHQAEFHLRATGVQSLRIELPAEAGLWATLVDGQPMEARAALAAEGAPAAYLVPLPPVAQPTAARNLKLFYRTTGDRLQASGALRQSPPRLAVVSGQGETQPLEILERDWVLFHPDGTDITSSTGQFEPVDRPARASLLGRLQESLRLESVQDIAFKGLAVLIAGAVIGALWLSFRRRGSSGLFATIAVVVILAFLSVVMQPAVQQAREAAQRMQGGNWKNVSGVLPPPFTGGTDTPIAALETPKSQPAADEKSGFATGLTKQFANEESIRRHDSIVGLLPDSSSRASNEESFFQSFRNDIGNGIASDAKAGTKIQRARPSRQGSGKPRESLVEQNGEGEGTDDVIAFDNQPEPPLDDAPTQGNMGGGQAPNLERRFLAGNLAQQNEELEADLPQLRAGAADVKHAPAKPADGRKQRARGGEMNGALLSLAMNLQPDSDSRPTKFHYAGTPSSGAEPELAVELQDRHALSITGLAWQAGVLLLFWFARRWSNGVRATLAVVGLVGPLALLPLVPLEALPCLDGLFLGTVWGLLMWGLLALIGCCTRGECRLSNRASNKAVSTAALLAVGTIVSIGTASVSADPSPNSELRTPNSPPSTLLLPTTTANPLQSDRILLPFDKFLELLRAAQPDLENERNPPRDGVVAEALYAAEFVPGAAGTKASVAVTGRFAVYSFHREQITLRLPLGRVSLRSATLDGKPAPIVSRNDDDGPELTIVLPERGAHVVDVQFSLPVEQSGPSGRFMLPLLPVPSGVLRFMLPTADQTLKVTGSSGAFRRLREGDKTVAVVPIDRGGDVGVAWAPVQARETTEGIVHAESSTAVAIDDAGLHLGAHVKFTVRQGTLSEASFALPAGLLVRRIAGLDLGGWETTGEGDQRSLKIFLRRPVKDTTALDFDLFQPQSITDQPQPVGVPQFAPQGVTRETGLLGVFAPGHLSATAGAAAGLTQIDAVQFVDPSRESGAAKGREPPARSTPPQLAYRFAARPFQLSLVVARQKPISKGVAEHACHVGVRKLRLVSRIDVQMVGAPRSEIAVQLPVGYLLYDLKSPAITDYYVATPAEGQPPILHVDLSTPRTGTVSLILDGILPRAADDLLPLVAVPFPLGLGDLRSALAIWLDRSFSATFDNVDGWKSIDPQQLPPRLRGARQTAAQLAFTSTLPTVPPIVLDLSRAAARLNSEALSVVMVRDTSVQYSLYLRWHIALAGEDTFVFTTPDWLADHLEIDRNLPGIRIRQVTSEKIERNRLRWTVSLEEPRETVLLLSAQAVLPPPQNARVAAPLITFEHAVTVNEAKEIVPLDNQKQYLLLVNQTPQRLDRDAPEGAVEPIPANELPIRVGTEISHRAAEILAVHNPAAPIGWQVQPAQALKALPASVNVARITLVVAHDGSWRAQADYRVNNRSRQFLAVRLPAKSRVLSLLVANQPARPIRPDRPNDPDVLLVPLPKTALGDLSAEIRLTFEGQLDRPLPRGVQVLRSELDLPAPQVLSQNEDPDFGAPVAATEWTVILPDDVDAARVDDPTRSNVAASSEGAEQLIATYQELLSLVSVASEAKSRNNLRQLGRATSNLKQLGQIITSDNYGSISGPTIDERQSRQLAELQQKWLAAQREIAALKSGGQAESGTASNGNGILSQKGVQREVIANNGIDFQVEGKGPDAEELRLDYDYDISNDGTASDKAAAVGKPAEKVGRRDKSSKNRAALKDETAAQSVDLNASVAGQLAGSSRSRSNDDQKRMSAPTLQLGQPLPQQPMESDADEVLEVFDREKQSQSNGVARESLLSSEERPVDEMRRGRRGGRAMAGVPIINKPAFLGELFAQQQDFHDLARDNRAADRGVDPAGEGAGAWMQPGGLSLEINIPQAGQKLTFSKPGGDARLALGLRPRASLEIGFGLIWSIVWLVVALGLIAALGRHDAPAILLRRLPLGCAILGLLWYFLLPAAALGFVLFIIGLGGMAWQRRQA